jgi:hypothetical protein
MIRASAGPLTLPSPTPMAFGAQQSASAAVTNEQATSLCVRMTGVSVEWVT